MWCPSVPGWVARNTGVKLEVPRGVQIFENDVRKHVILRPYRCDLLPLGGCAPSLLRRPRYDRVRVPFEDTAWRWGLVVTSLPGGSGGARTHIYMHSFDTALRGVGLAVVTERQFRHRNGCRWVLGLISACLRCMGWVRDELTLVGSSLRHSNTSSLDRQLSLSGVLRTYEIGCPSDNVLFLSIFVNELFQSVKSFRTLAKVLLRRDHE